MSLIGAAAISGGANLVGSMFSGIGAGRRQRRQNRFNREMADLEWKRNKELWNKSWEREVAYNDPSAQMRRLKDAGINPHMAYMSGGVQNTASTSELPKYNAPEGQFTAPTAGEMAGSVLGSIVGDTANLINLQKDIAAKNSMEAQAEIDQAKADVYRMFGKEADIAETRNRSDEATQKGQVLFETQPKGKFGTTSLYRERVLAEQQSINLNVGIKQAQKAGLISENDVKAYRAKLARAGIDPNANPIFREIAKAFNDAGIPLNRVFAYIVKKIASK
jgi:hypothetical protein